MSTVAGTIAVACRFPIAFARLATIASPRGLAQDCQVLRPPDRPTAIML